MLLPLAFAGIIICLSIVLSVYVCMCVRACLCLYTPFPPEASQIPCLYICMYIVLTACCLVYFFVYGHSCFYGFFFHSFLIVAFIFMRSLGLRARSPGSYGKSSLCVRMSMKFPALGPFALWSAYVPSLFY